MILAMCPIATTHWSWVPERTQQELVVIYEQVMLRVKALLYAAELTKCLLILVSHFKAVDEDH